MALIVLLSTAATARETHAPAPPRPGMADPSAVIAADLDLARVAAAKGPSAALRDSSAPAALILVPRPVAAAAWLKGRELAGAPADWQPRTVWASCDGGYAVTLGLWRRGAQAGEYFALWQRQARGGGWRWLLHEDGPVTSPGEAPEMIAGHVAECSSLPPRPPGFVPAPVAPLGDASRDGSLEWAVSQTERCAISVMVTAWNGTAMGEVLHWTRPAPAEGCG